MPLKLIFFVVIYFCCCFTSPAAVKLEWSFCKEGSVAYLSAQVPGTVHQDLLRHHRIPNPYWGTNIDSIQWVGKSNWVVRERGTERALDVPRRPGSAAVDGARGRDGRETRA